jgi:hypothetical protein
MRETGKNLWRAILAPPHAAPLVAIIAVAVLGVKIGYLNQIPEWFSRADEYGHVVQDLLVATMAAYIFFLLTVQLPYVREKRLVGPAVAILVQQIADTGMRFLYQANFELHPGKGSVPMPERVTLEVTKDLFARISPNSIPSRVPVYDTRAIPPVKLTWLRMLIADNTRCLQLIDELWRYARFVDPELAAHLYECRPQLESLRLSMDDDPILLDPDIGCVPNPGATHTS